MSEARPTLTFVIPVKNGAAFLVGTMRQVWAWLQARDLSAELLVVDDGSNDTTPSLLVDFESEVAGDERLSFRTLRNAVNRGKGYSLRRAFLHARGELVVFTDADLTYPVENVGELLTALQKGADVAIGSRMHKDSRYVVAPTFFGKLYTRHFMGRCFNLLVRTLVVPGVRDSQAGLKGFRREAAQQLAERVRLDRFSFDVEMLFVAHRLGLSIVDCPVLFLYRKEPSTVRFVRDSLAMIRDMLVVRWRGLRGTYRAPMAAAALQHLRDGGAVPEPAAAASLGIDPAAAPAHSDKGLGRTG